MTFTIISGDQTGPDQAALKAAIDIGFAHGGTCPTGRKDEYNRPIPKEFSNLVEEGNFTDYQESCNARTVKNIIDSDGTLIIAHRYPCQRKFKMAQD